MQLRPTAIRRILLHRDADFRHAMRWYTRIGRRVWLHEVFEYLFSPLLENGPKLEDFLGKSLEEREYAHLKKRIIKVVPVTPQPHHTSGTQTHILPPYAIGNLQSPQPREH